MTITNFVGPFIYGGISGGISSYPLRDKVNDSQTDVCPVSGVILFMHQKQMWHMNRSNRSTYHVTQHGFSEFL